MIKQMGKSFTPKDLLSLPRRSTAIPNSVGKLALYTSSTFSFEKKKKSGGIFELNLQDGASKVVVEDVDAKNPVFINDTQFLYLSTKEAASSLWKHDLETDSSYKLHDFETTIDNIQFKSGILAFSATVDWKGNIAKPTKPENEPEHLSYDKLFVRHWDTWVTDNKNAIFTVKPDLTAKSFTFSEPVNLLKGTGFESPVPPFGGSSDFSISESHVAFLAKDPDVDPAINTTSNIYLTSVTGGDRPVKISDAEGASSCPVISPDGKKVAYLFMRVNGYEADRNRIGIYDIASAEIQVLAEEWDRSPSSITWSDDSKALFLLAENIGQVEIYHLRLGKMDLPKKIDSEHSTSGIQLLPNKKLLVSGSSFARARFYYVLDTLLEQIETIDDGRIDGINDEDTTEFFFDSADRRKIHGFITIPNDFDESKKYPMAFLIHGGPQGAWTNSWSTRWNPAVFANHDGGWVVVTINPTGSTGYGQKLTDDIKLHWGDRPYEDLVAGYNFVTKKYKFIDENRAIAAGASYGGYMVNWIQGHDFGRKFKALICHDGVFNTKNTWYTTEELYFPEHDFGGTPWETSTLYEKFNPANFVQNWSTPQLVIHGSKDYRLTEGEGLAAFNVLQRRGIPSRLLIFKNENHWVLKPENSLIWHQEVLSWMTKWTN